MNKYIKYSINKSSEDDIRLHLTKCSNSFIPPLDSYVNINEYANKIYNKGIRFEALHNDKLIGLVAIYFNIVEKTGFITNISVLPRFFGKGVSVKMLNNCRDYMLKNECRYITLEANKNNIRAIKFYEKNKFIFISNKENNLIMKLELQRDYDKEIKDTLDHKYIYNFDIEVMHHYMIKSFIPFFNNSDVLELGSFRGDFTKRLLPYFDDIICVDASSDAIEIAKQILKDKVKYICGRFEEILFFNKYDNIILAHVLEHIDDPVRLLKLINDKWLSDNGRLFLVCPNANAASRQIAVKMGLISHNSAITFAESEHGHKITYSLDTLERDVRLAGLKIIHSSGIFFKALANFQWDKLLGTDIISSEYLEGCYLLGQKYPDLCSSIFLMCEKGK